ncbi:GTPase-activating protein RGD2 [Sporobolomyces salmoneus]|uniref:GTPase-activating protein RGD2 n=1 Tax=Sporobolomyces salmoneus TaxID=183962 RepID=UPI00316C09CB
MTEPPTPRVQSSVTLPPTFSNSFWSTDYRTGFTSIYTALESGIVQSSEILATVKDRVESERLIAQQLLPPALRRDGFASDEGASLRMGFEAILTSLVGESKSRHQLADELMRSVYLPFSKWSTSHSQRIHQSRETVEKVLIEWEKSKSVVERSREVYGEKCRVLDETEDELEFVRGREALLRSTTSANSGAGGGGEEEEKSQSGGGGIVLPPRPFEIDQNDSSTPLSPSTSSTSLARSLSTRFNRHAKTDEEQGSDDGTLPPIDNGDDSQGGEGFIDRSGATGGSVVAALGRALTVRRNKNGGAKNESTKEEGHEAEESTNTTWKVEKLMDEKNVKAALDFSKTKFSSLLSKVAGPQSGEERYLRARREAELSEEQYKLAVQSLDALRLQLEELLSTHLPYLQHCESDRLRAATSVLKSFHSAISDLPKQIQASQERVHQTLELIRTEKDLKLLIERRRTGAFQPRPIGFLSHYSEEYTHTFGIDLRKYDETNSSEMEGEENGKVPKVLIVLLNEIERRMKSVENTDERRKSWLYETPLSTQHALRSLLNSPQTVNHLPPSELEVLFRPFDLPILCSVVKLWLLELEVPVISFSAYDELRSLFPGRVTSVGENEEGGGGKGVDREGLIKVLAKLPAVHFQTLRFLLSRLYPLTTLEPISDSPSSDSRQTYLSKLSLSLSRPLLRPKQETALTLDDRFPAIVVGELLKGGEGLMHEIEEAAKKERQERYKPRRQRTKPIDVRPSRTNLGLTNRESIDPDQANAYLLEQQQRERQQQERLQQDLPSPPAPEKGESSTSSSLKLETEGLAPPVPIVPEGEQPTQFAASPMESTSAFPRDEEKEEDPTLDVETKVDTEDDEKPQIVPSTTMTETPFVPPSSSEASETSFVPPSSNDDSSTVRVPVAQKEEEEDKPLTSSTSLKRRSVQATATAGAGDKTATAGGGTGGSGRLRGARAPRPISSSASSVFDKVKQFEGN